MEKTRRLRYGSFSPRRLRTRQLMEKTINKQGHFDFVEIGTSYWGTLSGGEIWSWLPDVCYPRGVAVEPVREYLAKLRKKVKRNKQKRDWFVDVKFVNAAIGKTSKCSILYLIPPKMLKELGQLKCPWYNGNGERCRVPVAWYAPSMSSVGEPHPELVWMLECINKVALLSFRKIRMFSWGDLCRRVGLVSVDVVKIDAEGMDCEIVASLLEHCHDHPAGYPRIIMFEANDLSDSTNIQETIETLERLGYTVWRKKNDVIAQWCSVRTWR